ncbi:acyl carrier protein [Pendulispora albinea]|uniref:Acyl carrier protein n=1 Tax=Pendulispora albinea TaxID=2741071 RepID=A0ABZ2LLN0_9BACT
MSITQSNSAENQSPHGVIADWIVGYIATTLDVEQSRIDRQAPFKRLGLDSSVAVAMTGELGEWLGIEVDPAAPYDHPTIEKLAAMLAAQPRVQAALERSQRQAKAAAGAP